MIGFPAYWPRAKTIRIECNAWAILGSSVVFIHFCFELRTLGLIGYNKNADPRKVAVQALGVFTPYGYDGPSGPLTFRQGHLSTHTLEPDLVWSAQCPSHGFLGAPPSPLKL